jgi:hypothetical protein
MSAETGPAVGSGWGGAGRTVRQASKEWGGEDTWTTISLPWGVKHCHVNSLATSGRASTRLLLVPASSPITVHPHNAGMGQSKCLTMSRNACTRFQVKARRAAGVRRVASGIESTHASAKYDTSQPLQLIT